jgi:hypothetical protein
MMKLAIVFSMTIVAAAGAVAMPASASWGRPIGAQPEALIIGASLLALASILRHGSLRKKV